MSKTYKAMVEEMMNDLFDGYCLIDSPTYEQTVSYCETLEDMYRIISKAFINDDNFCREEYKEVTEMIFDTKSAIYEVHFSYGR